MVTVRLLHVRPKRPKQAALTPIILMEQRRNERWLCVSFCSFVAAPAPGIIYIPVVYTSKYII